MERKEVGFMRKTICFVCLVILSLTLLVGCVNRNPAPSPTVPPVVTEMPAQTAAPDVTAPPEATDAPMPTDMPEATEAPM